MRLRTPLFLLVPALLLAAGAPSPARGALVLSFNQPSYTTAVNGSVAVQVLLSQVAGGVQVTPANALLSAGITLTYDPAIVAVDLIAAGPGWTADSASAGGGTATLGLSSLGGIGTIPGGGLLLGTFTFRGLALGTSPLSTLTLAPGASFITANGDIVDPSNTARATLRVVPEPASALLVGLGGTGLLVAARRGRRRTPAQA
jgi:hypothetical protein